MKDLKNRLIKGENIDFSNENRILLVEFGRYPGEYLLTFKIWLNGEIVHISKSFTPFENKLNKLLKNDYN